MVHQNSIFVLTEGAVLRTTILIGKMFASVLRELELSCSLGRLVDGKPCNNCGGLVVKRVTFRRLSSNVYIHRGLDD